jgi:hypothetical protein
MEANPKTGEYTLLSGIKTLPNRGSDKQKFFLRKYFGRLLAVPRQPGLICCFH